MSLRMPNMLRFTSEYSTLGYPFKGKLLTINQVG